MLAEQFLQFLPLHRLPSLFLVALLLGRYSQNCLTTLGERGGEMAGVQVE